jgi:hypothetical protein
MHLSNFIIDFPVVNELFSLQYIYDWTRFILTLYSVPQFYSSDLQRDGGFLLIYELLPGLSQMTTDMFHLS